MQFFTLFGLFLALNSQAADPTTPSRGLKIVYSSPEGEELGRALASEREEELLLSYLTYRGTKPQVEEINLGRWQRFSEGGRYDYLLKMYFANTKEASNSGLKHAACFNGNPTAIAKRYFDPSVKIRGLVGDLLVTPSTDGMMMGLQFKVQVQGKTLNAHFRISHCTSSGKNGVFMGVDSDEKRRPLSAKSAKKGRILAAGEDEGFKMNDIVEGAKSLPRFELKTDFDRAKIASDDRPWKGMDISQEAGAFAFSEMVQAHFYEGMANQDKNPEKNFNASRSQRYWCHMPWLNQGTSQREAIHGLTKELDLSASPIYPDATPGSDWGVAYFNANACGTLEKIFGSTRLGLHNPPKWEKSRFSDGAMSVKILFTTADFKALEGAYTWNANVSLPKETAREIRPVRHVQMDIAVRDATLKGVIGKNFDWVMTSYYYDKTYNPAPDSPLRRIRNLPESLLHMRPIGTQVGFDKEDSIIFAGAKTNQSEGKLNGPADNPRSTCLGCHATAGTKIRMAPGVITNLQFQKDVAPVNTHLDYGQQVALAKRNFETRFRAE